MKKISSVHNNNLRKEIKIHQSLRHPNIIRFEGAVQVEHMVYIMLEYADNGALFFFINPRTGMPEKFAFKFFYQTALALEYLHSKGIMHRDIKPENILLDRNYDSKLCDFGWCAEHGAHLPDDESICGTYEYMPPEIVYEKSHNKEVDIWAIGVLLYELIHGRAPYTAESLEDIKDRMKQTEITFKKSLSPEAKDLLLRLLKFDPAERITLEQIFTHPFILKHLDEYENNKDSFKYIPPEPEWDNDLDIYPTGEISETVEEALAELDAQDRKRRFEEDLLSDPIKQQEYIKRQFAESKINSNDVEKVFFLRDETGTLKMRLQMKDRPQPMRGNSEKKNSLARATGGQKFQKIVGPNSPPKGPESQEVITINSKPSETNLDLRQGPSPFTAAEPAGDQNSKRLEPLAVSKPQSFWALHSGTQAPEPTKQAPMLQITSNPSKEGANTKVLGDLNSEVTRAEASANNSAMKPTLNPIKFQSTVPTMAMDSPVMITGQPNNTPMTPASFGGIYSNPSVNPLSGGALSSGKPSNYSQKDTFGDQKDSKPKESPIKEQKLLPTQPAPTHVESASIKGANNQPGSAHKHESAQKSSPTQAPQLRTGDHDKGSPNKPYSASTNIENSSPYKQGGLTLIKEPSPTKPNQPEKIDLNKFADKAYGFGPSNPVQQNSQSPSLIKPNSAANYQELQRFQPISSLPNPYQKAGNPDVGTPESGNQNTVIKSPPKKDQEPQPNTYYVPLKEGDKPAASPHLQHTRSYGDYSQTLKLNSQTTIRRPSPERDQPMIPPRLPEAPSQATTWTRYEPGVPIYPPKYDPQKQIGHQPSSNVIGQGNRDLPTASNQSSFIQQGGHKPVTGSTSTQSEFSHANPLSGHNAAGNQVGVSMNRPPAQQPSNTGYRPLTRSASRKEHTSNFTPPSSIPRLHTENQPVTYLAYGGNTSKPKSQIKVQDEMFIGSPESGALKRHLMPMGDRRLGMKGEDSESKPSRINETNSSFSYNNMTRIKSDVSGRKSIEEGKTNKTSTSNTGAFIPVFNPTLVQGSQNRYGQTDTSKKAPASSQKIPQAQNPQKLETKVHDSSQNKGGASSKLGSNSLASSPRDFLRNGATINNVINNNDLTAIQNDTSPVKKTSAQTITTLLNESLSKPLNQPISNQPSSEVKQQSEARPGTIVIRSGPSNSEGLGKPLQSQTTYHQPNTGTTSNTTSTQKEKILGHFESSSTSLSQGIAGMQWNQSRQNLDQSGILKTLPSSHDIFRTVNSESFHERQGMMTGSTSKTVHAYPQSTGITINSRKNSSMENEPTHKLRDMHGNELKHNTQSPIVYKQDAESATGATQNFGIYEGRSIEERSKSQSNPRRDNLQNQLVSGQVKHTVLGPITNTTIMHERKSLSGLMDMKALGGPLTSSIPTRTGGEVALESLGKHVQTSGKDFSRMGSRQNLNEAESPGNEANSRTVFRYSQTQSYGRTEGVAAGGLGRQFPEVERTAPAVSIYNPTASYINSIRRDEPLGGQLPAKPKDNLTYPGGLKFDYSGAGPQLAGGFGGAGNKGLDKGGESLGKGLVSWNRNSLPGDSGSPYSLASGYTINQTLNTSSPLINMKDLDSHKPTLSGPAATQPKSTLAPALKPVPGSQLHSDLAGLTFLGRTSSSSAGVASFAVQTTSVLSTPGPIPLQTLASKPQSSQGGSDPRAITIYSNSQGGSSLVMPGLHQTTSAGGSAGPKPTMIYSTNKPRGHLSPASPKVGS